MSSSPPQGSTPSTSQPPRGTSSRRPQPTARGLMAVLIASDLRKEFSGSPLFEGVSFKVERRDRVALAGPNGAGKTTLLRMLTGETRPDGGEMALRKGTRVALHDQRPPLERRQSLREYVLSAAADLVEAERELARLEQEMARCVNDKATT